LLLIVGWQFAPVVAAPDTVRFATLDFAPYALDKDSKRGFIVDMNAAISAKAGVEIVDVVMPIARLMKHLLRGQSDCSIFLLSPWSESNFTAVAEVHNRFDSIIITRKELIITRLEDLHGKLLALPRGSYKDFQIATDPKIRRHRTNGYEQSARLLKNGRVDAIAGTALSIYYYLSNMEFNQIEIGSVISFDHKPLWLHCAKQQLSENLIARLRQATNSLRSEGVFLQLLDRYTPQNFR